MLFYDDPMRNTPANGELLTDFQRCILQAWQTLLETHTDKHVFLVAHGGVIL